MYLPLFILTRVKPCKPVEIEELKQKVFLDLPRINSLLPVVVTFRWRTCEELEKRSAVPDS